MSEEWRTIPGFTRYQASTEGRVRSIGYNGRRSIVLKQQITGRRKYRTVVLRDDKLGRQRRRPVHVLVLLAHVGPRPVGLVSRHRDDNPANNTISNLIWGTSSENSIDIVRNGNHPKANTTHCPNGHPYTGENLYIAPTGRGGRQCASCHRERSMKKVEQSTRCKRGHEYPAEIQERIATRQKRRYCPICLANRKPRKDRAERIPA